MGFVGRNAGAWVAVEALEPRRLLAAPSPPVIIEPFFEGQVTGTFDINLQTDPTQFFDADGHGWQATQWLIREQGGTTVWQTGFLDAPPLTLYRVDLSDGQFVGPLAGRSELLGQFFYELVVRYRDSNGEVSAEAVRTFLTAGPTQPVPGAGLWLVRPGYVVEPVQSGLRLPVNIAFVPNPGPNPSDPLYYVAELYGSIEVVRRDGTRSTFATGLLDYNPQGPISGSGEQGLSGLAVERDAANPDIYHLYVGMLWDNGAPPGGPDHYPKVERITSGAGGLTMASRTVLLNMQPEIQGQSHQISNISIGPDDKLYVHMGDGFDASTALNLDMFRGKVLRMNKDGSPVHLRDPAVGNPFFNPFDGITARDYVFTYGHRNPFGGAWEPATGKHWVVENGNSLDRMVDLTRGASYGWAGNDSTHVQFSKYIWNPATAPVNIDFVDLSKFGGSMFPAEAQGHAYVSLSGSTYAGGVQPVAKSIVEFSDLDTLNIDGKLATAPTTLVKYNGMGRASVAALAAGPDGLYFSDLYEDTGAGGATAAGANIYRVRYVGDSGGALPIVAIAASASPNPVENGDSAQLSVVGDDDAGESTLTYTWGVGSAPASVSFTNNGTNAAKNTTARFTANGTYNLFVIIRDIGGQGAISTVTVTVNSMLSETGDGLNTDYYDNMDFTGFLGTVTSPYIYHHWGHGAPFGGMGADTFSVRWTGFVVPRFSETYTFYTTTDDGVRLWVNDLNTPIIDQFVDQPPTTWSGTVNLQAGKMYRIQMDYYENGGFAMATLEWSSPRQPREVVPQGRLYTAALDAPAAPTDLQLSAPLTTRVDLSWSQVAGNHAGFKIERSTDGINFQTVATRPAHVMSFRDTGVMPGTHYFYRVRATNPAFDSDFIATEISTPAAMAMVSAAFNPNNPSVGFTFDQEIVLASIAPEDLEITNLDTNTTTNNAVSVRPVPRQPTLLFQLPPDLPNGNYRFRIPAGAISSAVGPTATHADVFGPEVFVMSGDLNRDRRVTIADFITLASNFNKTGAVYAEGDLNYDGIVSIADFITLAANFNAVLGAPMMAQASAVMHTVETDPIIDARDDVLGRIDRDGRQHERQRNVMQVTRRRRAHHIRRVILGRQRD